MGVSKNNCDLWKQTFTRDFFIILLVKCKVKGLKSSAQYQAPEGFHRAWKRVLKIS